MPILRHVPVNWASVLRPNSRYDVYEVQVELTPEQAKALVDESKGVDPKGKGVKIKKEEDGRLTYRFKRRAVKPDGTPMKPPVCLDRDGKTPFTQNIGNGSICNVQYSFAKYEHPKFGVGATNDFKGIQVITHIPYGEEDGEGFDYEGDADANFEDEGTKVKRSDEFDDSDF